MKAFVYLGPGSPSCWRPAALGTRSEDARLSNHGGCLIFPGGMPGERWALFGLGRVCLAPLRNPCELIDVDRSVSQPDAYRLLHDGDCDPARDA